MRFIKCNVLHVSVCIIFTSSGECMLHLHFFFFYVVKCLLWVSGDFAVSGLTQAVSGLTKSKCTRSLLVDYEETASVWMVLEKP